jgi:hypothetical protein
MVTITTDMVDSKIKQMSDFEKDHYGLPNGEDFSVLANAVAASPEVGQAVLLHFMLIALSGKELFQEAKVAADDAKGLGQTPEFKVRVLEALRKHAAFRSYLDAIYLGYLLGRQVEAVESLEHMQK